MRAPHPELCAPAGECAESVCAPEEGTAGPDGCLVRPLAEGAFCTEDTDPCTSDACRTGVCTHDSDGSGERCADLRRPFRTALGVAADAARLHAEVATALACDQGAACAGGANGLRLMTLLGQARDGSQTAVLALAGRLSQPGTSSPTRAPMVRARLAHEVIVGIPEELRAFIATLRLVKAEHVITTREARMRRQEARRLLRHARRLKGQLRRLLFRRSGFAR
jgi:hypothetical protein